MKYKFKPAPNYRGVLSTKQMMIDLTIGLLVVLAYALYNAYTISTTNLIHIVIVTIIALVTSTIVEVIFAICSKKQPLEFLKESFPWVTALILVLIMPMNVSFYAMTICTICAIVFGKLVFGGFGNNIFNPAAVGRAVFATSFTGSIVADVFVGATPTTTISTIGWVADGRVLNNFLNSFGGLGNLAFGNYYGAIGETSAIVIALVGVYLTVKKVIDLRVTITYIVTIFFGALFIGLANGLDAPSLINYSIFHILTGGVMFGAIFMLTDPVTNPTTRSGKIIFAIGAGVITLIIRIGANLPEGVLFSILIMNMLTPAIDSILQGQQYRRVFKNLIAIIIVFILGLGVVYGLGTTLEGTKYTAPANTKIKKAVIDGDVSTHVVKGYEGENKFEIAVKDGKITNIKVVEFNDTVGIGDLAIKDEYLEYLKGANFDEDVDVAVGATATSESIIEACKQALGK